MFPSFLPSWNANVKNYFTHLLDVVVSSLATSFACRNWWKSSLMRYKPPLTSATVFFHVGKFFCFRSFHICSTKNKYITGPSKTDLWSFSFFARHFFSTICRWNWQKKWLAVVVSWKHVLIDHQLPTYVNGQFLQRCIDVYAFCIACTVGHVFNLFSSSCWCIPM